MTTLTFCEGVSRLGRRTYPPFQRLETRTEQKEKANGESGESLSPSWLWRQCDWPTILLLWLCCPWNGPYPQTVSPKPIFLSLGVFATWFATVTRQLAPTFLYTFVLWLQTKPSVYIHTKTKAETETLNQGHLAFLEATSPKSTPQCSYSRLISRLNLPASLQDLDTPKIKLDWGRGVCVCLWVT